MAVHVVVSVVVSQLFPGVPVVPHGRRPQHHLRAPALRPELARGRPGWVITGVGPPTAERRRSPASVVTGTLTSVTRASTVATHASLRLAAAHTPTVVMALPLRPVRRAVPRRAAPAAGRPAGAVLGDVVERVGDPDVGRGVASAVWRIRATLLGAASSQRPTPAQGRVAAPLTALALLWTLLACAFLGAGLVR
jgi:hypothetical protein